MCKKQEVRAPRSLKILVPITNFGLAHISRLITLHLCKYSIRKEHGIPITEAQGSPPYRRILSKRCKPPAKRFLRFIQGQGNGSREFTTNRLVRYILQLYSFFQQRKRNILTLLSSPSMVRPWTFLPCSLMHWPTISLPLGT